mmetsp:Transcript_57658/g.166986  ORF Transcript_57658/g.166986 Transcript_57658/m.166986 type:complete len:528 (+) Transcript_57658:58-1641(+)
MAVYSRLKEKSDSGESDGDLSSTSSGSDGSEHGCSVFDSRELDSGSSDRTEKHFLHRLHRLPKRPPFGSWPQEIQEITYHYHHSRNGDEPVPMGLICGPALLWAFRNVGWQMAYFLCLMPLGTPFLECTPNGLGRTPSWWFITLLPVVSVSLWFEMRAVPYVLVPMLQVIDHFAIKLPGRRVRLRACPWLLVQFWMSFLNVSNSANICAFTMRVMAEKRCSKEAEEHGHVPLGRIWEEVISQSFLLDRLDQVSLPWIGLGFWLLSFSPLLFAVLSSWPAPSALPVTYEVCTDGTPKGAIQYNSLLGHNANHGTAVSYLSEACGMTSVLNCASLDYAKSKFNMQLGSPHDKAWVAKCLNHAEGQCVRSLVRTFFAGTLKNALQLNLQITVYACRRASQVLMHEPEELMPEMLYSILLGIFSVLLILQDTKATWTFADEAIKNKKIYEAMMPIRAQGGELATDLDSRIQRLRCLATLLLLLAVVCGGLLIYAIAKLSMSFGCESAVGNINGCVDLAHLANATAILSLKA